MTSTSNCTTFQARRLDIRYRTESGKTAPVATLNGTLATTRWIVAILETHQMEYLYSEPTAHYFMNQETYEQISMDNETLGDTMQYLLPNTVIQVDFYDDKPVGIELPNTVSLEVVETEPSMKGATASASYKPAKMETGLVVMVPPFIEPGTKILIDTRENKYLSRG